MRDFRRSRFILGILVVGFLSPVSVYSQTEKLTVAKDNVYKFLIGTETPAFREVSDPEKCFGFRRYVVKTTPHQESGDNIEVYQRKTSTDTKSVCKETGSSHFNTESSGDFFSGLFGSLLFVTKDSSVKPYRDLTIYNLRTSKWLTEETYVGEPKLVGGRFLVFDSESDKRGKEQNCKDYAKWIRADLSITWVQGKKLDLQTLKISTVGGLRCLAYRLSIPDP